MASTDAVEQSLSLKLYEKNEWKALLHYEDIYYTKDNNFLLSGGKNPKQELIETIKSFYKKQSDLKNPNEHAQCKFPARKLFIEHELKVKNLFPKVYCSNFQEYLTKAPADEISLIYVSENVKHPTSMMGHSFFKLKGTIGNKSVSHAASFYTIIDSINIFKLAYQNFYSGMGGKFALRPYKETLLEYINEDRNVWEYQLNIDEYRRNLIYYHIWELKDVEFKYFFTSYNCSTVVYFALVLARPELYKDYTFWVSPLQTAKMLYSNNLIQQVELKPSNDWFLRMSSQQLTLGQKQYITELLENKKYSKLKTLNYLELQFLIAYANQQFEAKNLEVEKFRELYTHLNSDIKNLDNVLDISSYKSPSRIPHERQFSTGFASYSKEHFLKFSFLPASHFLSDDNREYFTESDLRIFDLSLIINKDNLYIDEFNLYSMKSYIPFEKYTKNFSYEFDIKFHRELNNEMEYNYMTRVSGGVGIDYQIHNDIHLFAMLNTGLGYDKLNQIYLNTEPYMGFMIYEIFNMKTIFQYSQRFINKRQVYETYEVNHNLFFSKKWKLNLNLKQYNSLIYSSKKINELQFSLNYMF